MYRSEWTNHTTLHLFPHWNWHEGDSVDMWAYYNNADEVELFVNGRSMGRSRKTSERLHAIWEAVPFESGDIEAVSYKGGKVVARHKRVTSGEPSQLVLTADRSTISADGYDLSFVTVECVDADGNMVPTAMNQLYFEVVGAGELAGVDNGNATGMESLKGTSMKLFNGKALAIVRSLRGVEGDITLTVMGDGVENASITISAK